MRCVVAGLLSISTLLWGLGTAVGEDADSKTAKPNPSIQRPNFIFFITDDVSPHDLGLYGHPLVKTPNLERLASRGLVFKNAYLTISSCSPSRCSMITGRYPHNTGAPELHTTLPISQKTFVQSLSEAGYYTLISGKNHMAPPKQLGFAQSSDSHPTGCERWVEHLRNRPKDRPFFYWFASHDAHFPFSSNNQAPKFAPEEIEVPPMLFDGPATRRQLSDYYHEVARTDYHLGALLDELEKQGLLDNTYVIYCSDNGRPFPRCKTYLYDSGIKTPLIIAGPSIANGVSESLISSIDYAATILELAGVKLPKSVQGTSFVPVLKDPSATTRDVAFAERNWHVFQNHARAVRTGDWLYVWNAWPERHNLSGESGWFQFPAAKELWEAAAKGNLRPEQALLTAKAQPTEMLFHVVDDPHQFRNLATDPKHQSVRIAMRKLLDEWIDLTGDSVPEEPSRDRSSLHEDGSKDQEYRGQFPGSDRNCESINHPGPVRTQPIGAIDKR